MNPSERAAHRVYIQALRRLTPEQRLQQTFDMTEFARRLFKDGLRIRFPDLSEDELHKLYLRRLEKCHNRNW